MSKPEAYGVFLHSSGRQGGYVVRSKRDGSYASPYNSQRPQREFRRESDAQRYADKLNGYR